MVEQQPSKLMTRVRFPSPAPTIFRQSSDNFYLAPRWPRNAEEEMVTVGEIRVSIHVGISNWNNGVLQFYLSYPNWVRYSPIWVRVRSVRSGTGAVERELSRLQRSGLVSVERIGNQKHYRANQDSPIFEELQSLVVKTVGLAGPIRKSLQPYADAIKAAFVYGSLAKGTDTARSDIDLMVIGDELNYSDLYMAAQNAEDKLRRKVNPTFLSPKDLAAQSVKQRFRRQQNKRFTEDFYFWFREGPSSMGKQAAAPMPKERRRWPRKNSLARSRIAMLGRSGMWTTARRR
jgi:predicted nucleotidyltransferase